MSLIPQLHCISAAPAALDRYLAALPAMSLIPFAPFAVASLPLHRTPDVKVISMHQERLMMSAIQPSAAAPGGRADGTRATLSVFCRIAVNTYVCPCRTFSTVDAG